MTSKLDRAIRNNSDVNILALKFDSTKIWCCNNAFGGISLVLCGDFYETYAGDAVRFAKACQLEGFIKDGLFAVGVPAHAVQRYVDICQARGLAIQLKQ